MQASKILIALTIAAGFATTSFAQGQSVPAAPSAPAAKVATTVAAAEQKMDAAKAGLQQAEAVKTAVQKPEVVKTEAPKADTGNANDLNAKGKALGKHGDKHDNNGLKKAKGAKDEMAKGEVKPVAQPVATVTLPAVK